MAFPSEVTIAAYPTQHFVDIRSNANGDTLELSGVEGKLLKVISRALKFHLKLIIPSDRKAGQLGPDGNWTGVIGMVQRDEADIGMNFLAMTEQRESVVDFSTAYTIDDTTFVVGKPTPLPAALAYLYPFVPILWASFAVLLLVMPLVFSSLTNTKSSYLQLCLQLFGNFVTQNLTIKDNSMRSKILQASWIIFTCVISLSYSAVLLSFLSIPLQKEQVRNFLELSNAVKKGEMKSYVIFGAIVESFLMNSQQSHLRTLGEIIHKENWYDRGRIEEVLINERSALIGPRVILKLFFGSDESTKIMSEDSLVSWNIALAVNKKFCCKKSLDVVISRLRSSGLYEKYVMEESLKKMLRSATKVSENTRKKQIRIKDIFSVLLLLIVGHVLSLLMLLLEVLYKYKCLKCFIRK
ncbi:glutamate receptor ionotropic, delta-2 [Caerostris darwini]|uniref:Glutamate receptor ionotropic, delta-2 n=1 Tax=Caerostris darwini TaxID=1538125 RepID=A0AAV4TM29_9ARAC|nr:glutamate receptor ionotropic, delta-2 [Caerostris darwini]